MTSARPHRPLRHRAKAIDKALDLGVSTRVVVLTSKPAPAHPDRFNGRRDPSTVVQYWEGTGRCRAGTAIAHSGAANTSE